LRISFSAGTAPIKKKYKTVARQKACIKTVAAVVIADFPALSVLTQWQAASYLPGVAAFKGQCL